MRLRQMTVLWLLPVLCSLPAAWPAASPEAGREVAHLIRFVAESGCSFYRNGSWYPGQQASEHLQTKYTWLQKRQQIVTAEDFIARAATRSSVSGEAYKVRCDGSAERSAESWLSDELVRYRGNVAAPPAPH
jgi:uncharacterized protein (DUF2126 family)